MLLEGPRPNLFQKPFCHGSQKCNLSASQIIETACWTGPRPTKIQSKICLPTNASVFQVKPKHGLRESLGERFAWKLCCVRRRGRNFPEHPTRKDLATCPLKAAILFEASLMLMRHPTYLRYGYWTWRKSTIVRIPAASIQLRHHLRKSMKGNLVWGRQSSGHILLVAEMNPKKFGCNHQLYAWKYIHIYMYSTIHIYTYTYTRPYIYIERYIHIHAYIHIYTYTYIHIWARAPDPHTPPSPPNGIPPHS
jgi:hypothetical protein